MKIILEKYKWLLLFLSLTVVIHTGLVLVNIVKFGGKDASEDAVLASLVDIPEEEVPLATLSEQSPALTAAQIGILNDFIPESALPTTGKQLNVMDFGAKGDGKADDTEAFRRAVASAAAYDTVYAPQPALEYVFTDTLKISKNIHFVVDGGIVYKGPKDREVISTENLLKCRISIVSVRDSGGTLVNGEPWGGYHGYENPNYTGVMMTNSKWTSVSIGLSANFTNGVVCRAATGGNGSGFWFNSINVTAIKDCLNGLEIRNEGKDGWVNSNVFYNTSFTVGSEAGFRTNGKQYVAVRQTNTNNSTRSSNANIFHNFRFEISTTSDKTALTNGTTFTAIHLRRASCWSFVNYRTELIGNNLKFCVIDFDGISGLVSKSGMTWGLSLVPVNNMIVENEKVEIINTVDLPCAIDDIYQFLTPKWFTLEQDNDLRSKLLQIQPSLLTLQGYSFIRFGNKGEEVLESAMTSSTTAVDNEVKIESSAMLALTLNPLDKNSTVQVNLTGSSPNYAIFCFREDGTLITSKYDSKGIALLAMDGYFADNLKAFRRNSATSRNAFSVQSDEVKYVTIGIYGVVSGYSVVCDNPKVQVLRYRENSNLNNYNEFFATSKLTSTTALVGTRVFDPSDPMRFWQMEEINGVKSWVFQGDATFGIKLSESGTYDFGTQRVSYDPIAPRSVTVENLGNQPTSALKVALSGLNPDSFVLSTTSVSAIPVGGTGSFTIKPANSLDAGDYSAIVTVSGNNMASQIFNIRFSVSAAPPAVIEVTVDPDEVSLYTGDSHQFSATVTGVGDPSQNVYWSVSGGVAQTSISASGLLNVAAEETASTLTVTATLSTGDAYTGTSTVTVIQPEAPATQTIYYDANGGEGEMPSDTVVRGDSYTVAANDFYRDNCSFGYWTTLADGGGMAYAEGETIYNVQTDITLYAQWDFINAEASPSRADEEFNEDITNEDVPSEDVPNEDGEDFFLDNIEPVPLSEWPGGIAGAFADTERHWAKDDIAYIVSRGYMSGLTDVSFAPDAAITYADFLMAAGKIAAVDVSAYSGPSSALPFVEWALDNDVFQDIEPDGITPNAVIPREQIAVTMVNYAKAVNQELPLTRQAIVFADEADISELAKAAVKICQEAGLIVGRSNNIFDPRASTTRGEASAMLHRFAEIVTN